MLDILLGIRDDPSEDDIRNTAVNPKCGLQWRIPKESSQVFCWMTEFLYT